MTPQEFGKYRLIERIAVGGTAEVFRATMVWPDGREDPVVLKKILPQHARDKYFRQLFREEALVVASLQHPNIVQIRDFGRLQGTFFLALEHVDGADLDTLLDAAMDGSLATYITSKICDALAYIHTRKSSQQTPLRIVHRDISPHNILISRRGEVKLADFGIAKSIIRDDRTTEGTIKGKFAYMSPEQATPGETVDARTDLFSLGAVLYELLLGAPPFRGSTDVETLERVRECDYTLDEARLPAQHLPLAAVLRRCLQRAPEERYLDAAAMGRDLEAHLARLDPPVGPADLAAWAERSINRAADSSGGMNQLVSDMLGAQPRSGGTAMLSSGAEPRGEIVQATPLEATREVAAAPDGPSRMKLVLLVVAVAGLTAVITLVVSGFFSRPEQRAATGQDSGVVIAAGPPSDGAAAPAQDAAEPTADLPAVDSPGQLTVDATLRSRRRRPHRRRPRRTKGHGRLTINSIPWARVYLDGKLLGTTPLRAVRVPAGLRRIVLKEGGGRVLRTFVARIPRGQVRTFSFDAKRP